LATGAKAKDEAYRLPFGSTAMPSGMWQTAARFGPKFVTTPVSFGPADAACGTSNAVSAANDISRRRMTIPPINSGADP